MAEPQRSSIGLIVLVVVVIVVAGVGAGVLYEYNHVKAAAPPFTVALGDNVTVNYIGMFGSGPQAGRVFDTSFYAVAINNVSYPKSLEFAYRGSEAAYTPLPVHVGPSGSYSLDGLTFGPVVTGFWQGLLGLPVNRTQSISVPPDLGYGPVISTCLATSPLAFTVPVLNPLTPTQFTTDYPGVSAAPGTEFTDPTYGWNDLVLAANTTSVVVENLASLGWSVPKSSWPIVVTGLNATTITLTNELSPANNGLELGHSSATSACGTTRFVITTVNLGNETFTKLYDFEASGETINAEIQGQTLVFLVTVVQNY
jgi:hypothetical protein